MIKKFRMLAIFALIVAMLPMSSICVSASGTTITVDRVATEGGGSIQVPISISNNTGILGATISVSYDSELTLKSIDQGTALRSLQFTKPGQLDANPLKVNWTGTEADETNGTLAILTFDVPEKAGEYFVSVSYDEDDILDADFESVSVNIENGYIKVGQGTITAENIGTFTADKNYKGTELKATAFKAELGTITGTLSFIVTPENGEAKTFEDSAHITDANIVLGIIVSGLADENAACEITVK